ncbi:hypothetical protein CTI12_AA514070 [Artemisia annua]|uniref:Reverse transcriptase zinc-binding domain-containing protein n=1 Tax=Artemisia annua TaxID=35608 RepID=A0A2U1LA07_ARTAN|nr:hypothetical protein CTI12_AA514070 [Artemisia annua]
MFLDKLPTRNNLSARGVNILGSLCTNCGVEAETRNHLFFGCSLALGLFQLLGHWWNIHVPNISDPFSWELWFIGLRFNCLQKLALEAAFFSLWWHIWTFRNATLFSVKKHLKGMILTTLFLKRFFG